MKGGARRPETSERTKIDEMENDQEPLDPAQSSLSPNVPPWPLLPPASTPPHGWEPTGQTPSPLLDPNSAFYDAQRSNNPSVAPTRGGGRRLLITVLVAALVGGVAGAGVAAGLHRLDSSSTGLTIQESSAPPGPGILSGNISIPGLVHQVLPAVVSIAVVSGNLEDEGTGMIVSSNGMVVTNNHVIALATSNSSATITVTESGTTKGHRATLVGTDPTSDVALLKVSGVSGLPTVTFGNSNRAVVGDAVVAIGNALGLAAGTPTVTQGIVSALGRTVTATASGAGVSETLTNMIQTDAAINPGNSGGPLLDSSGQVIGMNTAVAGATAGGVNSQNIGFAIPSAKIEALLPELQKGGIAAAGGGYLGVDITTLTPQLRQQYGFTPTSGAVILDVVPGTPASNAGLQQGDVIVGVDSTAITSAESLQSVIGKDRPGQRVSVTYYVGNERRVVSITLAQKPQTTLQPSQPVIPTIPGPQGGGSSVGGGQGNSGLLPIG